MSEMVTVGLGSSFGDRDNTHRSAVLLETLGMFEAETLSALEPFMSAFSRFLGIPSTDRMGGQHVLDADYFDRIEAIHC